MEHTFIDRSEGNLSIQIKDGPQLLREPFQGDVSTALQSGIGYYIKSARNGPSRVYFFANGEQIGDISVWIKNDNNEYRFTSIAVIPELQRKGIMSQFITEIFRPYMKGLYPDYSHVRDNPIGNGVKLRDTVERIEYDKICNARK